MAIHGSYLSFMKNQSLVLLSGLKLWNRMDEYDIWYMYIPDLVQRLSFKKPSRTTLKAGSHIRDLQLPGFILFHCPITWAPKNWWLVVFYTATLRSGRTGTSMPRSTASTFHQSTVIRDPKTPSNFSESWNMNHHILCVYRYTAYIHRVLSMDSYVDHPIPLLGSETAKMFLGFGSFNIFGTQTPHMWNQKCPSLKLQEPCV